MPSNDSFLLLFSNASSSIHIAKSVFVVFALPNIFHIFFAFRKRFFPSFCRRFFVVFAERRKTLFAKFLSTFVWVFFFSLVPAFFSTLDSNFQMKCAIYSLDDCNSDIFFFHLLLNKTFLIRIQVIVCSRERKSALSDKRYKKKRRNCQNECSNEVEHRQEPGGKQSFHTQINRCI